MHRLSSILLALCFFASACAAKRLVLYDTLTNKPAASAQFVVSSCCKKGVKSCVRDKAQCTTNIYGHTDAKGRTPAIAKPCKGVSYLVYAAAGPLHPQYERGFTVVLTGNNDVPIEPCRQCPYQITSGGKEVDRGCTDDCGLTKSVGAMTSGTLSITYLDDDTMCVTPNNRPRRQHQPCIRDVCAEEETRAVSAVTSVQRERVCLQKNLSRE